MYRMFQIIPAVLMGLASFAGPAFGQETGEDPTPPPPSINQDYSKPPICDWVCVQWTDEGVCARHEYSCH